MRQSAAVLCRDKSSTQALQRTLGDLGIELLTCATSQEALELVVAGRCTTLIVDFDLSGAEEVTRMAGLLPPAQRPVLLAVASRAWPGTGQAFQSGANRILYRPLDAEQIKEALKAGTKAAGSQRRKATRYELKTLVYLDFENVTVPAITIDISEHGLALQATEAVPMNSSLHFRCVLPGTEFTLRGHADVMWASDQGRAGLFFSKLAPASRKQLKHWLHKRSHAGRDRKDHDRKHETDTWRDLLPPEDVDASFSVAE
jgi:ActR/RegA family two-component response regulator